MFLVATSGFNHTLMNFCFCVGPARRVGGLDRTGQRDPGDHGPQLRYARD